MTTSDIAVRTESGEREGHDEAALVGNVYSISLDTPTERLYSRNEHYDRHATTLDDVNAYCRSRGLTNLPRQGASAASRRASMASTRRTVSG